MIDFSDDEDAAADLSQSQSPSFDFVADIKERTPAAPTPPSAPKLASTTTGFPQPRKRAVKSAFKRQREQAAGGASIETEKLGPPTQSRLASRPDKGSLERDEKRAIAEENRRRLQDMSPAQVKREREELMESLPPSLLERFLRRATLDDGDEMNSRVLHRVDDSEGVDDRKEESTKSGKTVTFDISESQSQPEPSRQPQVEEADGDQEENSPPTEEPTFVEDAPPAQPPSDLFPASEPPTGPIHFPRPPPRSDPMPNLDPSSPSFLSDLQAHYFPETPHDPSSLSWLDPSADDTPPTSAYHAQSTATSLVPGAIRFSLTGTILAPRTSLSLPTTLGLHHHGDDPEAAGYTIPELAIFSRSSLPAQRCLAWQVLGRLLYRLGKGEFGERGDTLVEGLWEVVEREGVVARMMIEASGGETGAGGKEDAVAMQAKAAGIGKHASARAWATEAIWLWRQASGGDRGLLKEGQYRST